MIDKEETGIWVLIAILGVSLLFVGSLLVFILSYLIDQALSTTGTFGPATRIVSITLNGFLTLALILIYRDIRSAESNQEKWMEKQTDILNEQQNLSKAQLTPLLSVSFADDDINDDEITLTCTNTGTGIARELNIELELFVSDKNVNGRIYSIEGQELTPLSNIDEEIEVELHGGQKDGQTVYGAEGFWASAGALRRTDHDSKNRTRTEPVVKPDTEMEFKCGLRVMHYAGPVADPGDATPISFESATSKLSEKGYTVMGYRIRFSYEDLIGESQGTNLLKSGFTELEPGMNFSEVASNSVGEVGRVNAPPRYGGQRDIAMVRY